MKNIGNESKEFDLGAILSITAGRLFTDMDDYYDILSYLIGEKVSTLSILSDGDVAKKYILSLYPELEGIGVGVVINSYKDVEKFVGEQKKIYGDKLSLTPMPRINDDSYVDPIAKAAMYFETILARRR